MNQLRRNAMLLMATAFLAIASTGCRPLARLFGRAAVAEEVAVAAPKITTQSFKPVELSRPVMIQTPVVMQRPMMPPPNNQFLNAPRGGMGGIRDPFSPPDPFAHLPPSVRNAMGAPLGQPPQLGRGGVGSIRDPFAPHDPFAHLPPEVRRMLPPTTQPYGHVPGPVIPGQGRIIINPGEVPVPPSPVASQAETAASRNLAAFKTELNAAERAIDKKDWAAATAALDRAPSTGLPSAAAQDVAAARTAAEHVRSLERVKSVLAEGKPCRDAESVFGTLPPKVGESVREAAHLEELSAILKLGKIDHADQLEKLLVTYAGRAERAAVNKLRAHLADKVHDTGDEAAARRLLSDVPADTLPPKLRDLKLSPENTNGFTAPSPRPVIPEAPAGVRASVDEPFAAGLPKLEKDVAEAAFAARGRAEKAVGESFEFNLNGLHQPLARLTNTYLRDDVKQPTKTGPAGAKIQLVGLDRPLTPTDRILVDAMRAKGKSDADIVAELKKLDDDKE